MIEVNQFEETILYEKSLLQTGTPKRCPKCGWRGLGFAELNYNGKKQVVYENTRVELCKDCKLTGQRSVLEIDTNTGSWEDIVEQQQSYALMRIDMAEAELRTLTDSIENSQKEEYTGYSKTTRDEMHKDMVDSIRAVFDNPKIFNKDSNAFWDITGV